MQEYFVVSIRVGMSDPPCYEEFSDLVLFAGSCRLVIKRALFLVPVPIPWSLPYTVQGTVAPVPEIRVH